MVIKGALILIVIQSSVIPTALFYSLAIKKLPCLILFVAKAIVLGLFMWFSFRIIRWEIAGVWLRHVLLSLYLMAVVVGIYINASQPLYCNLTQNLVKSLLLHVFVGGLFAYMIAVSFSNVHLSEEYVDLEFPLKNVSWIVAHGGDSVLINHHRKVKAQTFGIDISAVNQWGMRAKGIFPADLNKYEIYDKPVYAPCDGKVVSKADGYSDLTPPDMDSRNPAGNYVAILCRNATLVLAHLKEGSIKVKLGQKVIIGEMIARVGNSGNTSEPHLHIHALKGEVSNYKQLLWPGEPMVMVFGGRYLIRGERQRQERHNSEYCDTSASIL